MPSVLFICSDNCPHFEFNKSLYYAQCSQYMKMILLSINNNISSSISQIVLSQYWISHFKWIYICWSNALQTRMLTYHFQFHLNSHRIHTLYLYICIWYSLINEISAHTCIFLEFGQLFYLYFLLFVASQWPLGFFTIIWLDFSFHYILKWGHSAGCGGGDLAIPSSCFWEMLFIVILFWLLIRFQF